MGRGRTCSVLGCTPAAKDSVFSSPKPKKSWDLYISWVKATGNPKFLNVSTHKRPDIFFCQKHFTDEELALLKTRRKNFIPTFNLPDPLNLNFGIDVNIPDSTGSNLVSAKQPKLEEPLKTEADIKKELLTELTCKTADVELSEASLKYYSPPKPQQVFLHDISYKPKPVFFPLFKNSKLVDPLKLNFEKAATNPERNGTCMVSSRQKRKYPPSSKSSVRKRLSIKQNIVQQLSGEGSDEVTYDTKHELIPDPSVSPPDIKCVDLGNMISSQSLHCSSPDSDVDAEMTSDIYEVCVHIQHCMLFEFDKGSTPDVATKNICDVYPHALDVLECQRWFSKFKSGDFNLSDFNGSGGPTT